MGRKLSTVQVCRYSPTIGALRRFVLVKLLALPAILTKNS